MPNPNTNNLSPQIRPPYPPGWDKFPPYPNTQYIGARYVPLLDGEWQSDKVYEALTIVTYQNSSYTSKKPVPAGTVPTNTEYWVLTGNLSGQIGEVMQEIAALQAIVDTNTDDITELTNVQAQHTTDITNLTAGQTSLTSQINTHTSQITALNTSQAQQDTKIAAIQTKDTQQDTAIADVTSLANQNMGGINTLTGELASLKNTVDTHLDGYVIFLSDSYGTQYHGNWVAIAIERLRLGSKGISLATDGGNFYSYPSSTAFQSLLENWATSNPEKIPQVRLIVVGGGINDSAEMPIGVLPERINSFVSYASNTFLNAKIAFSFFGWALDTSPILSGRTAFYREQCQYLYGRAGNWGCIYYGGLESILHNRDLLDSDQLHPNDEGGLRIANAIVSCIKGGDANVSYNNNATITPVAGTTTGGINQSLFKNTLYTYVNKLQFDGINITFSNQGYFKVADVILPLSNKMLEVPIYFLAMENSKFVTVHGTMKIENNEMFIRVWQGSDPFPTSYTFSTIFEITAAVAQNPISD